MDVDGTLLDSKTGIPLSAIQAIRGARKKGHKVFVSTGRAKSEVGSTILDIGFDGCIYSSGAVVEVEDQLVHMGKLDAQMVVSIMTDLGLMGIGYILEGYDYSYIDKIAENYFSSLHKDRASSDENNSFIKEMRIKTIHEYDSSVIINKISIFAHHHDDILKLKERYETNLDFLVYERVRNEVICVELYLPGITKATGMDVVLDYCAVSLEQTISFGDSRNDMEMVQHAQLGISMGNGIEALKQVADDVTDTLQNDGIYKAFEKYGLL